ncbi:MULTISPECIES: type VI secretion system lipoprotein TssJ [Vibrio]|uniref:Type VI secretion system lipoprotein TssJ n=1 Tax=Vibrio tasmaniensis TaxID=212663 RepID=A0A2N7NNU1_9VIBR|nr:MULTISPECIES: type VI secretion system lipoprotein TssJ [Vibrio]PMP18582.1 type VI secretion system-associated lipoprotein [Vibrio tasmaniensis]TKG30613.1 type VI secretion system lipoprotein TssJ [Vibrio tasmaniensis]TKG39894.1 type VI secretion system lipoprotein TssJ [Vibrio tasmaniensis]TKG44783.1 type VI secretion system lipoprotein TssJ [Vibrio tasmaniensis]TKG49606.1 type VI secretion system lipoprotein TssJ [Vibrio tasmaniensis]
MKRLMLLSLCLMITACSSSDPAPVVTQYSLTVKADTTVNQYNDAQANPVVVRLYQLTDQQLFKQLPFIDLYNNDLQLLAANLVSKQVLPIVLPNSEQQLTLDINKNTQYIAALIEFADYQNSTAKTVLMMPADPEQTLELTITGKKAELASIQPDSSWW